VPVRRPVRLLLLLTAVHAFPALAYWSGASHCNLSKSLDVAFLALDRNKNGVIDNGAELFGNHTPLRGVDGTAANGFQALQMFDDNQDGVLDKKDLVWWHLLLWTDRNHDGISQPDELVKLAKTSVIELDLDYHWTGRADRAGNRYEGEAIFRTTTGAKPYYDVYFVKAPD
jgi:hypothetical protein